MYKSPYSLALQVSKLQHKHQAPVNFIVECFMYKFFLLNIKS